MRHSVLVLALALALGACAWSKPGGTPEALKADESACDELARTNFPPQLGPPPESSMEGTQPGYSCAPNRGCVATGGSYLPPPTAMDVNQAPRQAAAAQCMEGKGWSR